MHCSLFFAVHPYLCLTFIYTLTYTLASAPLAPSRCLREWVCVRLSKVFVFSRILFVYSFCMAFNTHTRTQLILLMFAIILHSAGFSALLFARRAVATTYLPAPGLLSPILRLATKNGKLNNNFCSFCCPSERKSTVDVPVPQPSFPRSVFLLPHTLKPYTWVALGLQAAIKLQG